MWTMETTIFNWCNSVFLSIIKKNNNVSFSKIQSTSRDWLLYHILLASPFSFFCYRDLFDRDKYWILESSTYHCSPQNKPPSFFFTPSCFSHYEAYSLRRIHTLNYQLYVWGQCTVVDKRGTLVDYLGLYPISVTYHTQNLGHIRSVTLGNLPNFSGSLFSSSKTEDYISQYMRIE